MVCHVCGVCVACVYIACSLCGVCILCTRCTRGVRRVCVVACAHSLGPARPCPPRSGLCGRLCPCALLSGKRASLPPDPSPAESPAPQGPPQTLPAERSERAVPGPLDSVLSCACRRGEPPPQSGDLLSCRQAGENAGCSCLLPSLGQSLRHSLDYCFPLSAGVPDLISSWSLSRSLVAVVHCSFLFVLPA